MGQQQLLLIVVGVIIVGLASILAFDMIEDAQLNGAIDNAISVSQNYIRECAGECIKGTVLGGYYSPPYWVDANRTKILNNGFYQFGQLGDVVKVGWEIRFRWYKLNGNTSENRNITIHVKTGAITIGKFL